MDSFTMEIYWGDSAEPQFVAIPAGVRTFEIPHLYADDPAGREKSWRVRSGCGGRPGDGGDACVGAVVFGDSGARVVGVVERIGDEPGDVNG